jgi:outer membrane protein assembly factor BamD
MRKGIGCGRPYAWGWIAPALILISCACATAPEPKREAVVNFDSANYYFAQGKFEPAQRYYHKIIDEMPDSPFRIHALLGSADSYFMDGDFVSAAPLYSRFVELYPLDEQTPRAMFYIGMSYFKDVPKISRDQTNSQKACDMFAKFVEKYPVHFATTFAQEKIEFLDDRLAEKTFMVAEYYFNVKGYVSCIGRVEDLLEKYPKTRLRSEALLMKARSYAGEEAYEKARLSYLAVIAEFPGTKTAAKASAELRSFPKKR